MKNPLLALGMGCVALVSLVTQAAPTDLAFQQNLRNQVLEELSRESWRSACYVADSGLGSILSVHISDGGEATFTSQYYLDVACKRKTAYQHDRKARLRDGDGGPNRFQLIGDATGNLSRHGDVLVYRDSDQVIHLYMTGGES